MNSAVNLAMLAAIMFLFWIAFSVDVTPALKAGFLIGLPIFLMKLTNPMK